MSDATRCGSCGWVYWTTNYENWGTCPKCETNNDYAPKGKKAELVSSDYIFTYMKDHIPLKIGSGLEIRYKIKERIARTKSDYQTIEIIDNPNFGKMMFLDGDLQISEADRIYDVAMNMPFLVGKGSALPENAEIAILGGGDGGVLRELLQNVGKVKKATLVDIDGKVIQLAKKHLRKICKGSFTDPRSEIIVGDARDFLKSGRMFDGIIYDLTMDPGNIVKMSQGHFLRDMFGRIKKCLKKGGTLSMQCCSTFDKKSLRVITKTLHMNFNDVDFRKFYIPSFCEEWVFGCCRK